MPSPWPRTPPNTAERTAYAGSALSPYWADTVAPREAHPALRGHGHRADLAIIGGGFTGLWAALAAAERDPGRRIVLLEATRCGDGASTRNGGFASASLTHGLANGLSRFPEEIDTLERLGRENLAGFSADLSRLSIDAELERTGELDIAVDPERVGELSEAAHLARAHGQHVEVLDRAAIRARVHSNSYQAALFDPYGTVLVNPAKLVEGLRRAVVELGVEVHEYSPVRQIRSPPTRAGGTTLSVVCDAGTLEADRILLATSASPGLLRRTRWLIAPVYDYVLMTEPLDAAQRAAIGWSGREGVADTGERFHYYRLSADDRILWGGYEAIYRYGGPVRADLDAHEATFAALSQHFFHTFPQLEGLRFSHRWGGAIDTCSRFSVCFPRAHGGRVVAAVGYTGLGVAASRWGARTALDLLDARASEATALAFVRHQPVPFPPEPLRWGVITLTRNRLAAAEARGGRRGLWLATLDRAGLGFDS